MRAHRPAPVGVIALYCPDLPPVPGGLPNHSSLLARTLQRMGAPPAVLGRRGDGARLAPLPCALGLEPRDVPGAAARLGVHALIVQYVPFLFGRLGLSPSLCLALRQATRRGIRIALVVHEPYVPFTRLPWLVTGWPMRWQLRCLVRLATWVYVPVPRWARTLRRYARAGTRVVIAPMGANLPTSPVSREEARRSLGLDDGTIAIGLFGPAASGFLHDWVAAAVQRLAGRANVRWVRFGFGSARPYPGYPIGPGTIVLGDLEPKAIGRAMRALDIALAPYVDGLTLRRSIPLLAIAHGVATVSSTGHLFDPVASEIAACEASPEAFADRVARLVDDPGERAALASRTARFDELASIGVLARHLIEDLGAA